MINKTKIESTLSALGLEDYKWINPPDIVVSQWVRVKCMFGCGDYGLGTCPPNTPSIQECKDFMKEYSNGLVLRFNKYADKNNYPSDWIRQITKNLLELERLVFLQGYHKVFLLNISCCDVCKECSKNRVDCKDKKTSRPSPEGFAIDVYQTVRKFGFELNVVTDNPAEMNRFSFLLVD